MSKTNKKELNNSLTEFMKELYFGTGEYCYDIGLLNLGEIERHVESIRMIIERSNIEEG